MLTVAWCRFYRIKLVFFANGISLTRRRYAQLINNHIHLLEARRLCCDLLSRDQNRSVKVLLGATHSRYMQGSGNDLATPTDWIAHGWHAQWKAGACTKP